MGRPPLALLASDQELAARSVESVLAPAGFAVLRAHSGREALRLARTAEADALILEAHMPDLGALEICRQLRTDERFPAVTPIVVTSMTPFSRGQRLACYQAGAWVCYGPPLDGAQLVAQLHTFVRAKRTSDQMRGEAFVELRTGLYTLLGLKRRLQELAGEARRRNAPISCIALGLAPSSEPGKQPLETELEAATERLAVVVKQSARCSDIVGRLGRTELALVAPWTAEAGALRLIERVRETLAGQPPIADAAPTALAVRAGYSATSDFAAERMDGLELLLQATSALRDARGSGGATIASRTSKPVDLSA